MKTSSLLLESDTNERSYYPDYNVVSEICFSDELGRYSSYGIQIVSDDYAVILHDVSTCDKTVEGMTELFHRLQLSHIHLKDAVEDILLV